MLDKANMKGMRFDKYIGIDYSGAQGPLSREKGLRIFQSDNGAIPREILPSGQHGVRKWNRQELAHWLLCELENKQPVIVGIDHGFSYPHSFFSEMKFKSWDEFLIAFDKHWPTRYSSIAEIKSKNMAGTNSWFKPYSALDANEKFRLTERYTSSASSVRDLTPKQGTVSYSSHAGIAWLVFLRQECQKRSIPVHFWPFDGWELPANTSAIVEMYPSMLRRRLDEREFDNSWTGDQRDAYSLARWLSLADANGILDTYCNVPLTAEEREIARKEGWILGVM